MDTYLIKYEFLLAEGNLKVFDIEINRETMTLVHSQEVNKPEWTRLERNQCRGCPLDKNESPFCPIAVNISELVDNFKDSVSHHRCSVRCTTPERIYIKEASIQEGLFSILGIIMATSECPVMDLFKPMARFHLPFSTMDETVFRSTSVYMLRQYFEFKKGNSPDLELINLEKHYERVREVNHGIFARTRSVAVKDADQNAINILNSMTQMLSMEIEENLESLEYLFLSPSRS